MKKSYIIIISAFVLVIVAASIIVNIAPDSSNDKVIDKNKNKDNTKENANNGNQNTSNYLQSLVITGHDITFTKDEENYTVYLTSEQVGSSLNITAVPEDSSAKVEIANNDKLEMNDRVTITVTPQKGESRIYYLSISDDEVNDFFGFRVNKCDKKGKTYCEKYFTLNNKRETMKITYDYLTDSVTPHNMIITLDGNEIYNKEYIFDYFGPFYTLDDVIIFVYHRGTDIRSSSFMAVSSEGNVLLDVHDLDKNNVNMVIKDFYIDTKDYFWINGDTIYVKGSKLTHGSDVVEGDSGNLVSICDAKDNEIVNATYEFKYLGNNNFADAVMTSPVTVKEFRTTDDSAKEMCK